MIRLKRAWLCALLSLSCAASSLLPVMAAEGMEQAKEQVYDKGDYMGNATQITFGKTIKEVLVDDDSPKAFYKFKVTKPGAVTFALKGTSRQSGKQSIGFHIYDSEMDAELTSFTMTEKNNTMNDSQTRYYHPGDYYLVIWDHYWNYTKGYEYALTVTYKEFPESFNGAKNNSYDAASSIVVGKEVKGLVSETDNVDWYRFTVPSKDEITIKYVSDTTGYQTIKLYDKEVAEITYYGGSGDSFWDGTAKKYRRDYKISLDKGVYYLAVLNGKESSEDSYGPYSLTIKGTKSAATATVKSVAAKNMTYTGKVLAPSFTVKGSDGKTLTQNKTFTYTTSPYTVKKVGSYTVTVKGKGDYTGSKKTTFSVNPAKPTVGNVSSVTKGFKLAIQKDGAGAENYQIQYSTSKKFPGSTTMKTTVKKGTKSKTVTGLSSKETYYVRVRSYTKVGTKYYYSGWSEVKTVKTK